MITFFAFNHYIFCNKNELHTYKLDIISSILSKYDSSF